MENNNQKDILEYCLPHITQMWASYICSIILHCDFRDVTKEKILEKLAILTQNSNSQTKVQAQLVACELAFKSKEYREGFMKGRRLK